MKKNLKHYIPMIFVILLMLYMLISPNICIEGAKNGLLLWFNKVLPSLLPFIILTNILSQLGVIFKLSNFATPFTKKLLGLPGISFFIFIMGLIAGYPMGAKLTNQFLESKDLTYDEAQKTLCFCNNCGPLFIIGTVGTAMLKNPKAGYFLLTIHILSALLLGFIVSKSSLNYSPVNKRAITIAPQNSFYTIFNTSVQNAMDTIVYVGGYIIFFSVLAAIIQASPVILNILSYLSHTLHISLNMILSAIIGSLELSTGIAFLSTHIAPNIYTFALIAAILSFGGFCVFFQASYVLQNSKLSLRLYLFSKLIQAFIAFSLTCILYPIFFRADSVFSLLHSLLWILVLLLILFLVPLIFHILCSKRSSKSLRSHSIRS